MPCSRGIPFSSFIDRPEYNSGMLYMVASKLDIETVTETRTVGAKVDDILFDFNEYQELLRSYFNGRDHVRMNYAVSQ